MRPPTPAQLRAYATALLEGKDYDYNVHYAVEDNPFLKKQVEASMMYSDTFAALRAGPNLFRISEAQARTIIAVCKQIHEHIHTGKGIRLENVTGVVPSEKHSKLC